MKKETIIVLKKKVKEINRRIYGVEKKEDKNKELAF